MPTTNTNFSSLITAIDTKAQSLAASTTDPKDLVYLGKAIEAMNVADTVSAIITEGDTQVADVNTAGTTQVNNVNTAGTTQVAAVNTAGANFARKDQNLSDLTDAAAARTNLGVAAITSTTPSDGQVLTYDAVTSAYVNRDASSGGAILDLGHAIDNYSTGDVLDYARSNYHSSDAMKNDGVHSIQATKSQFGLYGMFNNSSQNNFRAIAVPFQVNQSTGAITVGTPNTLANSSGASISTTIAGDAGIGIGAIMGRMTWSSSYVIVSFVMRFDSDNTVNMDEHFGTDYNTNYYAHPQGGFVGVLGNPARGDNFSQTTGLFGFHGYGGSQGSISSDQIMDINTGANAGSNPTVSNSSQGSNWSTSHSNTSTAGSIVADYLYTDTFDRIIFAAGRYYDVDSYKIYYSDNNSSISRTNVISKLPGEAAYNRAHANALAFTNGYHAIYCMNSGEYHLFNTSRTKVGEGVLSILDAGVGNSSQGQRSTRRIGDNLFWIASRYGGKAQIATITPNTTTNKLEFEVLATVNATSDSAQYTAAYLTGTNNEYLVIDNGMFNAAVYDIGSQLDLSAY